ncbi:MULTISPECIES: IS3 family transposase [unclassified Streptomyces]|uniref:IS3 family transposase n=1 Tax=unclassified Streptomyces TaxID=2593676 RepID=UPI00224CACF5|nr:MULTISPECIES: IS3 family transposase [unclassified Streptomyces]MCX4649257.1 IS3 family transposase [Streptomyces sp. NBC_01446]MCX5321532.1 IS3 family transposase [Streptomyces sp. NBC_00120]
MTQKRRKFSPEFRDEAVKMVVVESRPIAEVAREIQVNEGTLGTWVSRYRQEHAGEEPPLSISERARLRELQRENRELRMKTEFLGKNGGLLRPGIPVTEKYEFIDDEADNFPVQQQMCTWAGVSTSGFYHWKSRPLSATAKRRAELSAVILQIFSDSQETYGYRRVHAALQRMNVQAGAELVRALMRELGLVPCQPRPWRATTIADDAAPATPDLLARDFTADAPGRKLVSDITYVHTWAGFLYLATVIDCHTKAVVGWAMADHMKTSLISDALDMAARNIDLAEGCIFHSDRGSQYTSRELRCKLRSLGLRASVGRTGVCWDNAMAESFFGALKNELVHRTTFPTRAHARRAIVRYIEMFYNRKRLHSGLGYKTPAEVHAEYEELQTAA